MISIIYWWVLLITIGIINQCNQSKFKIAIKHKTVQG